MFVLPSWAAHEHVNASDAKRAILFSITDTPLVRAVDKYRVQRLDCSQEVTGTFDAASVR
jgi:gentisate 1,2-dioxygenase